MRNGLRLLTIAAALFAAPMPAHAQLGDPIQLPFGGSPFGHVRAASSGPEHGTALIVDDRVHFADASGRWRSFRIVDDAVEVRLARLEDGGGLAAWDDGDSIQVRTWGRDGALAPARAVLERGSMGFEIAHDGAGTVLLATAGEQLVATVRDPGGTFTVPQRLGPASAETPFSFSAVVDDGNVSVSWDGRRALRTGRAPAFASAAPVAADPGVLVADGSRRVPVGPAVREVCSEGCADVRLFTWADGTARLLYRPGYRVPNVWYLARRAADGTFDGAVVPSKLQGSEPVWTAKPGIVAFARSAWSTVGLVPYGVAPRRKARFELLGAFTDSRRLHLSGLCSTTCRLSVRGGRVTKEASSTGTLGPVRGALEPLQPTVIELPRPRGSRVRVTLVLRDAKGRKTRQLLTLRRGTRRIEDRQVWRSAHGSSAVSVR